MRSKLPSDKIRAASHRIGVYRSSATSKVSRGRLRRPTGDGSTKTKASPVTKARGFSVKKQIRAWVSAKPDVTKKFLQNGMRGGASADKDDSVETSMGGQLSAHLVQTQTVVTKGSGTMVRKGGTAAASVIRRQQGLSRRSVKKSGQAVRRIRQRTKTVVEESRKLAQRAVARTAKVVQAIASSVGGQLMLVLAAVMVVAVILMSVMSWMMTAKQPKVSNVPAEYQTDLERAGSICQAITAPLIASQIEQESGWNSRAGSSAGAQGIAQFMPGTWASVGLDGDGDGKADVWNPHDAIWTQGHYMCNLVSQMQGYLDAGKVKGDVVDLALAAYNAGSGNVLSAGGIPNFEETKKYVARIKALMVKYSSQDGEDTGGVTGQLTPSLVMASDGWHVNVAATGTDEGAAPSYEKFQCTWWAAIRRAQIGRPVDAHMGNGNQWGVTALRLGMKVGSKPAPGDVISFQGGVHGSSPTYGHVAVVEAVNADGSILISQSGTGWMAVVTETISAAQLASFGGGISFVK